MIDLFGQPIVRKSRVIVFHDERIIKPWLYHGYVLVEERHWAQITEKLLGYRDECGCQKAVHFKNLTAASSSSTRTRLAVRWAKAMNGELLKFLRFHLLGVDNSKLDKTLFGKGCSSNREVQTRIYNRFFEIGLFSAIRWFFTDDEQVAVTRIVAEERQLPDDDPFLRRAPYMINQRDSNVLVACPSVDMIPGKSDAGDWPQEARDCLQLTDMMVGGFSQILDYSSESKRGCIEVADALYKRVKKLNDEPRNKNSRAYKRLSMSFFPDKSVSEQQFKGGNAYGLMYNSRRLKMADRNQLELW